MPTLYIFFVSLPLMNFASPWMLLGLFSVVIPVAVHLFNLRKYKKVYFTNVHFLQAVIQETSKLKKLKEWLILACRVLAFIFLALSFAQPFFTNKNNKKAGLGSAVSVFLDNSYSMEATTTDGTLLDAAKRKAKEIANAYPQNTKFQLLTCNFSGVEQRLLNKIEFTETVEKTKISTQTRKANDIIARQADALYGLSNTNKEVFLISDFQKGILDENIKTDTALNINLVPLAANKTANISIDSVWLSSPIHRKGQPERILVRTTNHGLDAAENLSLTLKIAGQQKALAAINIPAESSHTDTLTFTPMAEGYQSCELSLIDFPIIFDDKYYFTFNIATQLNAMVINADAINNLINNVLATDNYFKITNNTATAINYNAIGDQKIIYLNGLNEIPSGLADALKRAVNNGASLVVFPGININASEYNSFLRVLNIGTYGTAISQEIKVSNINYKHQVLTDVFEKTSTNIDLPTVKKYYPILKNTRNGCEDIMSLQGNNTLIMSTNYGQGSVYLSSVPLDISFSNIGQHFLFLPLIYKMALLSSVNYPAAYVAGSSETISTDRLNNNPKESYKLKNNDLEFIPDVRNTTNQTQLYIQGQASEAGFYNLTQKTENLATFAFNYNRAESQTTFLPMGDIERFAKKLNFNVFEKSDKSLSALIKENDTGVKLWKYCLMLAILFFLAEMAVIRFFKK